MNNIAYRPAEMSDLSEISGLVSSAILEMERNGIYQWDELYPTPEDLSGDISCGELYVGTVRDKIAVIYAINQNCDDEYKNGNWQYPNEPFSVIHRLCVSPEFQRMGIAAKTVSHIENELQKEGIKVIRLDVFTENPYALRLYEKLGFKETGKVKWRKGDFFLMEKYIG
ncbi:GNAT family N-acetyltransferase [Huintestinicola sp.]|uniref:GNAT family N-acetyltransferase n=1 Tax=Huintestinicola sp. TaxID=2981661 RepID=UPI003D7CF139